MYTITATCHGINCESDIDMNLTATFECEVEANDAADAVALAYEQDDSPVEFEVVEA